MTDFKNRLRRKITGFLFGAGLAGFATRGVTEFSLWFGTGHTAPDKTLGLLYPVSEHGTTFYLSAGETLLHWGIPLFWLMFIIGLLATPRKRGPDGKPARGIDDPDGARARWAKIGAAITLPFMTLAHPLAYLLLQTGWHP